MGLGDASAVSTTEKGKQVTQVVQGLSVQISGIYSYTEEPAVYDENNRGAVTVYTLYPGATLNVLTAPTYDDSEGRTHGQYKLYMKNGDAVELFPNTGPFTLDGALGIGGESAYIVKFRRPAAELEVYQITWEAGDSAKQVVPLTEEPGADHPVGEGTGAAGVVSGVRPAAAGRRGCCLLHGQRL